ncbi:MAG: 2-dehydropantoate 2-reductase [Planctomycetota bacterium]
MSLTYTIIGTGALGGYYGGQLARAGCRVNFLVRSDFDHVQEHGLRVDLIPTDETYVLKPDTHDVGFFGDPADLPPADVVLVCLKTTQNHQLPELLQPNTMHNDTLVVTMQNGLHPERDIAAIVGEDRTAGGLCFLCSNKLGPGHISYLDYGFIKLGAHPPRASRQMVERLEQIANDFRGSGVKCDAVDDLVLARWQKLVWNVPYNGLSVVSGLTTDQIMADPTERYWVRSLMQEVVDAAAAVDGKVIGEEFIEAMIENTLKMAPYKTSMMLDYESARPMEIEAIVGDPLRAIHNLNQSAVCMERIYDNLIIKEHEQLTSKQRPLATRWQFTVLQWIESIESSDHYTFPDGCKRTAKVAAHRGIPAIQSRNPNQFRESTAGTYRILADEMGGWEPLSGFAKAHREVLDELNASHLQD